ncbi:hypothetical protein KSK55_01675 [Methanospirillum purgamenti]|jgi:hypothetical protein|uniref:Uncharacterized protein n=1 Tax=Methanospirillum hungatei TaxID=2203 RepID=A0A8F5VPB6_METHU|nr:hypothetical protein [Methanospirillum hungatei]QXO95150.1 hypothetical protein KSK55_01675 [Methanospirillum hungatei]
MGKFGGNLARSSSEYKAAADNHANQLNHEHPEYEHSREAGSGNKE